MIYKRDMAEYNLLLLNAKILVDQDLNLISENENNLQMEQGKSVQYIDSSGDDSSRLVTSRKLRKKKRKNCDSSTKSYCANYTNKQSDAESKTNLSSKKMVLKLHRIRDDIFQRLLSDYNKNTDIDLLKSNCLSNELVDLTTSTEDKGTDSEISSCSEIVSKNLIKLKRKRIVSSSLSDDSNVPTATLTRNKIVSSSDAEICVSDSGDESNETEKLQSLEKYKIKSNEQVINIFCCCNVFKLLLNLLRNHCS